MSKNIQSIQSLCWKMLTNTNNYKFDGVDVWPTNLSYSRIKNELYRSNNGVLIVKCPSGKKFNNNNDIYFVFTEEKFDRIRKSYINNVNFSLTSTNIAPNTSKNAFCVLSLDVDIVEPSIVNNSEEMLKYLKETVKFIVNA